MTAVLTLDWDTIYPRDEEHRYRLYAVVGDERRVLAAGASGADIGAAIVTLEEDAQACVPPRRLCDEGRIGIMDVMPDGKPSPRGRWIIPPYDRRPA